MTSLRPFKSSDMAVILPWMLEEEWQVSETIIKASHAVDPDGFLMVEDSKTKEVLGCNMGCKFNEEVAFGSFFIVRRDLRGKGLGKLLWDSRWKRIGHMNFGMDSVAARIDHNRSKGIVVDDFYCYEFMGEPPMEAVQVYQQDNPCRGVTIIQISREDSLGKYYDAIFKLDTEVHTIPREAFLKIWLDETVTFVALQGDKLLGYGSSHSLPNGFAHVGPVFANRQDVGLRLLADCVSYAVAAGASKVGIDSCDQNPSAREFLDKLGLEKTLVCLRHYTKARIAIDHSKVFAITTLGVALI